MKTYNTMQTYYVLQFKMNHLFGAGDVVSDGGISPASKQILKINHERFRYLLQDLAKDYDPDTDAENLIRKGAVRIPVNSALRLLYLIRENVKKIPDKQTAPMIPADPMYYIRDFIYIDLNIDGQADKTPLEILLNGLTVEFEEGEFIRYRIFERSAAQVRNNMLVLIRDGHEADKLREHIDCGLDKSLQKVFLSKYTCYRGLSLTSGVPVENAGLYLGEKPVVFVEDFKWKKICEALNMKEDLSCECATVNDDPSAEGTGVRTVKEFEIKSESVADAELFDGEGIISPAFAEFIRNRLGVNSTSFQIRMPYIKGMVHEVDFERFLREECGYNTADDKIQDAFGSERRIKHVHMILPLSMFKAHNLYEEEVGGRIKKGMTPEERRKCAKNRKRIPRKYFEAFREGKHCMLISSQDPAEDYRSFSTETNYQFVSTLDADGREKALLRPSLDKMRMICSSPDVRILNMMLAEKLMPLNEENIDPENFEAEEERDSEQSEQKEQITCARLLSKNSKIFHTSIVDRQAPLEKIRKEFGRGHLTQPGSMKYLSGDLLVFLYLLREYVNLSGRADRTEVPVLSPEKAEELKNQVFRKNRPEEEYDVYFYEPGVKYSPGTEIVMSRNPHLTKNENVIVKALDCPADSLYEKYFSHLTGIVMIRVGKNRIAERLGGADYDGDIVRIFRHPEYVKAARVKPDGVSELPLLIPHTRENAQAYKQENIKKLILGNSANKIGQYSNEAFRVGLYAYGCRGGALELDFDAAEKARRDMVRLSCGIGLEIDSVKSGIRPEIPDLITSQLSRENDENTDYFLKYIKYSKTSPKSGKKTPESGKSGEKTSSIYFIPPELPSGSCYSLVEHLPFLFRDQKVSDGPSISVWAADLKKEIGAYPSLPKIPVNNLIDLVKESEIPKDQEISAQRLHQLLAAYQALEIAGRNEQTKDYLRADHEASKSYDAILAYFVQRYGRTIGEKYAFRCKQIADSVELSPSGDTHAIFRLIEWRNYPNAELRRKRINEIRRAAGDVWPTEKGDLFDELFCEFDIKIENQTCLLEEFFDCVCEEPRNDEKMRDFKQRVLEKNSGNLMKGSKEQKLKFKEEDVLAYIDEIADPAYAELIRKIRKEIFPDPDERNDAVQWLYVRDLPVREEIVGNVFNVLDKHFSERAEEEKTEIKSFFALPDRFMLLPLFLNFVHTTSTARRNHTLRAEKYGEFKRICGERRIKGQIYRLCEQCSTEDDMKVLRRIISTLCSDAPDPITYDVSTPGTEISGVHDPCDLRILDCTEDFRKIIGGYKETCADSTNMAAYERLYYLFHMLPSVSAADFLCAASFTEGKYFMNPSETCRIFFGLLSRCDGMLKKEEYAKIEKFLFRTFPAEVYDCLKEYRAFEPEKYVSDEQCGYFDGIQKISCTCNKNVRSEDIERLFIRTYLLTAEESRNGVRLLPAQPVPENIEYRFSKDGFCTDTVNEYFWKEENPGVYPLNGTICYRNTGEWIADFSTTVAVLPAYLREDGTQEKPSVKELSTVVRKTTKSRPLERFVYDYRWYRRNAEEVAENV